MGARHSRDAGGGPGGSPCGCSPRLGRAPKAVEGTLLDEAAVAGMLIEEQAPDLEDSEAFAAHIAQARAGKDFSTLKSLLKQVADSNYELRGQWQVPRTVPVSHDQCLAHKHKVRRSLKISFSTMSTADALLHFAKQKGAVVCGLNFANGEVAGGGYKNGATAQEEDLCRRIPTLYSTLFQATKGGLYPFGPPTCQHEEEPNKYADVLYTSNLVVARDGEEGGFALLPGRSQAKVSLVSAAAPNVKFKSEVSSPELIYSAIESIFLAPQATEPGVNTLVLGAWGCGAFGGDPAQVGDLFVQALARDNLGRLYREVHFAIPCSSPHDKNYDVFLDRFRKHKLAVKVLG